MWRRLKYPICRCDQRGVTIPQIDQRRAESEEQTTAAPIGNDTVPCVGPRLFFQIASPILDEFSKELHAITPSALAGILGVGDSHLQQVPLVIAKLIFPSLRRIFGDHFAPTQTRLQSFLTTESIEITWRQTIQPRSITARFGLHKAYLFDIAKIPPAVPGILVIFEHVAPPKYVS